VYCKKDAITGVVKQCVRQ